MYVFLDIQPSSQIFTSTSHIEPPTRNFANSQDEAEELLRTLNPNYGMAQQVGPGVKMKGFQLPKKTPAEMNGIYIYILYIYIYIYIYLGPPKTMKNKGFGHLEIMLFTV